MSIKGLPPQCYFCKHFDPSKLRFTADTLPCPAFPDGIPPEILNVEHDHTKPLRDEKVLFEAAPGMEDKAQRWSEAFLEMHRRSASRMIDQMMGDE